jgi:hypothetical protein
VNKAVAPGSGVSPSLSAQHRRRFLQRTGVRALRTVDDPIDENGKLDPDDDIN